MIESPFLLRMKEKNPAVYTRIRKIREEQSKRRQFNLEVEKAIFWRDTLDDLERLTHKSSDGFTEEDIGRFLRILAGILKRF
jgi:hypothetical protein